MSNSRLRGSLCGHDEVVHVELLDGAQLGVGAEIAVTVVGGSLNVYERYRTLELEDGRIWTHVSVAQPQIHRLPTAVVVNTPLVLRLGAPASRVEAARADDEWEVPWNPPRRHGTLWSQPHNLFVDFAESEALDDGSRVRAVVTDATYESLDGDKIKNKVSYSELEVIDLSNASDWELQLQRGPRLRWVNVQIVEPQSEWLYRGDVIVIQLAKKHKVER